MEEELMLVTLLHDVGKILQRAGEKPVCKLKKDSFHEHDMLTCDFLREYLGEEYVELFMEGRWKIADYVSASERIEYEKTGLPSQTPLLDPALDVSPDTDLTKLEGERRWYPVTFVDFESPMEVYRAVERSKAVINYKGILKMLKELANKAKSIKDPESLLETYDFIYKNTALLVPAAVYNAIPNTSLYGHSRLAAPLSVCNKARLLVVDIKGIQKFITNIKGEKETSKRLRGRSFFLQLLQRALSDKIADALGFSALNNISFEPGKLIFIVCNDVRSNVNDILLEVEKWSNYELQFASSISEEFQVDKMRIFSEREEDKLFANALNQAFENLNILGSPDIIKEVDVDVFGDIYPADKLIEVDKVGNMNTLTAGEKLEGRISIINLISLIVGHSTRNLKYVVEVIYKDGKKGENKYLQMKDFGIGEVYIDPLGVGFFLVHGSKKDIAVLKSLIQSVRDQAKRIKIFTVNDSLDFIYPELVREFDKISFGYIALNTYHPVDEEGRFKSLDDIADYIGLGITDGDRIGEIVKKLSAYPGRFMTFSSLMDFAFTGIITANLSRETSGDRPVVILYSGGDDIAVYGKWDEVLKLLGKLSLLIPEIIPQISVSGGIFVFKKKYPIALAYSSAKELEGLAKAERRDSIGRVACNLFEYYAECVEELCKATTEDREKRCKGDIRRSFSWDEALKLLDYAEKLRESAVPSAYIYKVYSIADMIGECEIPRALVTYAYLNERNKEVFSKVRNITENFLVDYPHEEESKAIKQLLKFRSIANMYALLKREGR